MLVTNILITATQHPWPPQACTVIIPINLIHGCTSSCLTQPGQHCTNSSTIVLSSMLKKPKGKVWDTGSMTFLSLWTNPGGKQRLSQSETCYFNRYLWQYQTRLHFYDRPQEQTLLFRPIFPNISQNIVILSHFMDSILSPSSSSLSFTVSLRSLHMADCNNSVLLFWKSAVTLHHCIYSSSVFPLFACYSMFLFLVYFKFLLLPCLSIFFMLFLVREGSATDKLY